MINRYKKYFNANIVLAVIFVATIGFMAVKTLPIQGVTNFIKAPLRDIRNDENTYVSKYEKTYADKFQYKYKFLNLHGAFASAIGKREINGVFEMGDGFLIRPYTMDAIKKQVNTSELIRLREQYNYLFLQNVINYDGDYIYPNGEDYDIYSSSLEKLEILKSHHIDVLDLNEQADKEHISKRSMFFKTDHHWTSEAAFWGYQKLVGKLNRDYGCNIDDFYTDINNFNIDIYENWMLGSAGKRVGHVYAGLDDMSVIYPKFETNMTFSVPSKNIYKQGEYKDTVLEYKMMSPKDYYNNEVYSVYIGANYDYAHITNINAPENKSILLIQNSFLLPINAFLSTCFKDVHIMYVYNENVRDYIEKINPDIIVINSFRN